MAPPSARRKRLPPSRHGRLFGGDALYQVLAELAKSRSNRFTAMKLAQTIQRTPEHTRSELEKLLALDVIEEVARERKARVYAVKDTPLTNAVLDLPTALVQLLGAYKRP